MSSNINAKVNSTIFREYIGVKPSPDNFNDYPTQIINASIQEFHFILGFATDPECNGNFQRAWNDDYFGAKRVRQLKADYPNVKVVISIGGRGPKYPFNPAATEQWIDNAKNSVIELIEDYRRACRCDDIIDGIDINYEEVKSSETDFAHCIGKLITKVKAHEPNDSYIKVVSIAPSRRVSPHYMTLYREYQDHIDWVDYQFYKVSSWYDFVPNIFNRVANAFRDQTATDRFVNEFLDQQLVYRHKLLAGYSTDSNDTHGEITEEVFIEGCNDLVNRKLLAGVFLWNAHDSAVPKSNDRQFNLEEKMQSILTNND